MIGRRKRAILCLLFTGMVSLNTAANGVVGEPETEKPMRSPGIEDQTANPHSDLIFRATGASSCRDCHGIAKNGALIATPMDNDRVRRLREKAKGIHGPGRFADCLRCHAGGSKGVEKY